MIFDRLNHHLNARIKAEQTGRLVLEISLALAIKFFLLWLIWVMCFAHPISKADRQQVVTHVILN